MLDRIDRTLRDSDPRLVALFSIFTRLTWDEEIPRVEEIRARLARFGGWIALRTLPVRRRIPRPSDRVKAILFFPAALAAVACALLIGGSGPAVAPLRGHGPGSRERTHRQGPAVPARRWCGIRPRSSRTSFPALTACPALVTALLSAAAGSAAATSPPTKVNIGSPAGSGLGVPANRCAPTPQRVPGSETPISSNPSAANHSQICGIRSGSPRPRVHTTVPPAAHSPAQHRMVRATSSSVMLPNTPQASTSLAGTSPA